MCMLSRLYSGNCLYFSNSDSHASSVIGGRPPCGARAGAARGARVARVRCDATGGPTAYVGPPVHHGQPGAGEPRDASENDHGVHHARRDAQPDAHRACGAARGVGDGGHFGDGGLGRCGGLRRCPCARKPPRLRAGTNATTCWPGARLSGRGEMWKSSTRPVSLRVPAAKTPRTGAAPRRAGGMCATGTV